MTDLLTNGGHNTGIVVPPGEQGRFYQVKTKSADAPDVGPHERLEAAPHIVGSWWTEWTRWRAARSGEPREPPMGVGHTNGRGLPDAPGDYVRQ